MLSLFQIGQVVATRGDAEKLSVDEALALVARHASGDWGEVDEDDRVANAVAMEVGTRILSAYTVRGTRYWVITEADRSATTVLLPEEY